ncbi:MAG: hypothetical protein ACKOEE_12830 [Tagaea sp.]
MNLPLSPEHCAELARALGVTATPAQGQAMATSLAPALTKVATLRVSFEAEPAAYAANIAKGRVP